MEKIKIVKSTTFVKFTVNKCDYCHKPILNQSFCKNQEFKLPFQTKIGIAKVIK